MLTPSAGRPWRRPSWISAETSTRRSVIVWPTLPLLFRNRVRLLSEVGPAVRFLFDDVEYDEPAWAKTMKGDAKRALEAAASALESADPWDVGAIETVLRAMLDAEGLSARKGLQPIRVAISGSNVSPPLFESLAALPKHVAITRITEAAARISDPPLA